MNELINIDIKITLFLNSFHNDFFDVLMYYVSNRFVSIPIYAMILFFLIKQSQNKKEFFLYLLSIILLVLITDQGSIHLFKNVFERLRPCHNPDLANILHTVNGKCGGKFGFVSSHAANTFGFSIFIYKILKNKYVKYFIIFWAIIVSYSRIYLGVHYFGDVLLGAIYGIVTGFLVYYFILLFSKKQLKE